MSKKMVILISATFVTLLIVMNIHNYMNNTKISKFVEESNYHSDNIVLISKFRTEINEMSQAQKLYLLTSKPEYKISYEQHLDNIYKSINNMEASGGITTKERDEIKIVVNQYAKTSSKNMEGINKGVINEEIENKILMSNESQINILKELEKSVDQTNEVLTKKNNTIVEQSKKQNSGVQAISTAMTGLGTSILYFLKKNASKVSKEASEFIDCINKIDLDEDKNKESEIKENKDVNSKNQNDYKADFELLDNYKYTKEYVDTLLEYEKMYNSIKLTYKQSNKIDNKLTKINMLINDIFSELKQLKLNIEECQDCPTKIKIDLAKDIEDKIVQLKILFETIPINNEIVKDCCEEIIIYNNEKKIKS